MRAFDAQVLELLRSAPAGIGEGAVCEQLSAKQGYVHPEIVGAALRRLAAEQHVAHNDNGLWSARAAAPAPKPEESKPITEEPTVAKKSCPKHPTAEFTPGGTCKECKRESNRAYLEKKAAGGGKTSQTKSAPAPLTKHHIGKRGKGKKKANGTVPMELAGDRMVIMQFAIRIEDSAGHTHDLFLTGDTVKRLAIELQEYL